MPTTRPAYRRRKEVTMTTALTKTNRNPWNPKTARTLFWRGLVLNLCQTSPRVWLVRFVSDAREVSVSLTHNPNAQWKERYRATVQLSELDPPTVTVVLEAHDSDPKEALDAARGKFPGVERAVARMRLLANAASWYDLLEALEREQVSAESGSE